MPDRLHTYHQLRTSFPHFIYEGYAHEISGHILSVTFLFSAGDHYRFKHRLNIDVGPSANPVVLSPSAESLLFHLGMVEMISYWKAFCSPVIDIPYFHLSDDQQQWWKKLFRFGLGEFFYTNGIPVPGPEMLTFRFQDEAAPLPGKGRTDLKRQRVILPVGGGKDSAVSLEILREAGRDIIPFVVNRRGATDEVLKAAGHDPDAAVNIQRAIDPLLLELNEEGFLNGHTPFSAMLAFASAFIAEMMGVQDIALSNESSASEPSIPDTEINHQYSKSIQFEKDFRRYMADFLSDEINYFSLLRPLNELQISAIFSKLEIYHQVFKSCNVGSKTDIWCGTCPKCLFTYIMLSPFLSSERLFLIFGKNLFADPNLKATLDALTGADSVKPFECVGTIDEVNVALSRTIDYMLQHQRELPVLLAYYQRLNLYQTYRHQSLQDLLQHVDADHCLEPSFERHLRNFMDQISITGDPA